MKKVIMLALGAGLFLGSCSKDYLEVSSTRTMSKSDIDEISKTSPHLKDAMLYGIYAYNMTAFSGGTTGHDDFGQKGYDIYMDMVSGDMNLNDYGYGWYSNIANLSDLANQSSTTNFKPWRFYYFMVRSTNQIIVDLIGEDGNGTPKSDKDKLVLAEAKALRAYMYYNLVNMYTVGYDANEKILPIYKAPSTTNTPAKPTKEVFELMVSDLKSSLALYEELGQVRVKDRVSVDYNVAKGMLAYVYAAMGTSTALVESAKLSKEIIETGLYPLATKDILLKGFNKINDNPNWMWGGKITTQTNLDLVSWWGQVDVFTYSYAAIGDTKGMSKELYMSIPDKDVRKKQFSNQTYTDVNGSKRNFGADAYVAFDKFYSGTGKIFMGQRIVESDYLYMRVEEMYLLNAEVNARLGNTADAANVLTDLMSIRIDDTSYIAKLNNKDLLDEVLKQSRIELWGEGKVYAAIKRNKKTFHYGSNHLFLKDTNYSYNDSKLTFKVPQEELLNNPVYYN